MAKRLPKTLYVSYQNTGSGHPEDEFLNATQHAEDHAETGETVWVGRYELIEVGTVTAEPTFVPRGKQR